MYPDNLWGKLQNRPIVEVKAIHSQQEALTSVIYDGSHGSHTEYNGIRNAVIYPVVNQWQFIQGRLIPVGYYQPYGKYHTRIQIIVDLDKKDESGNAKMWLSDGMAPGEWENE